MTGRQLLRAAWWRPLPGTIATAIVFAIVLNLVAGIVVAALSWLVALAFSAAVIRDGATYRRRPWA
jgi:hypothetical protein